jgi:hypothetical protein
MVHDLEQTIRQKQKYRRGIVQTDWSFHFSVYPYVVYSSLSVSSSYRAGDRVPWEDQLSARDIDVEGNDANFISYLGKCYLMAQELVPLLVNLRGVANNVSHVWCKKYILFCSSIII